MYPAGTLVDSARAKYPTSQDALHNAGFVDAQPEKDTPSLIWIDGVLSMEEAENIKPHQRVNKIPCMDYICFKSTLFEELNNMRRKCPNIVNFYPQTYLLPTDYPELQRFHAVMCGRKSSAPTWVIKPKSGSCGRGIYLIQSAYEASNIEHAAVAQLMVDPMLLDGYKFDFRFFLLVSSLEPFSAFIYKEGIARFCTETYSPPTRATRDRQFMNLTNTAVNVGSSRSPEDFTKPASEVLKRLPCSARLWDAIRDCSALLLAAIYPTMMATLPNSGGRFKIQTGEGDGGEDRPKTRARTAARKKSPVKPRPKPKPEEAKPAEAKPAEERKAEEEGKTEETKEEETKSEEGKPEEAKTEEPKSEEGKPAETKTEEPKMTQAQHYFHLLGIDIIIDSEGKPFVLELNDRPSLSVTVPFEKDLKTNMLREMFYHVTPDGSTLGDNPESGWQQILPVEPSRELANSVKRLMSIRSKIKYTGRVAANSPTTNRMLTSGINVNLHEEHRQRANELRESAKGRRFYTYTKPT